MPVLANIRNYNLKIIFLVHFILSALSSMGFWSSTSYLFYNFILILLLIWSIYQDQNHENIQLAIVVNGAAVLLDILLLIMGFPDSHTARERFSAAMAIIHLLFRPFSTILLIKNLEERSGAPGALTDILVGRRNESYENIDAPTAAATPGGPTAATGGYDFSSAQQI